MSADRRFRRRTTPPPHSLSIRRVKYPDPNDPAKHVEGFDIFNGDKPMGLFFLTYKAAEVELEGFIQRLSPG